jgi:hypothetical protein
MMAGRGARATLVAPTINLVTKNAGMNRFVWGTQYGNGLGAPPGTYTVKVTAGGVTQTVQVSPTRGYMSSGEAVEHFGLGAATAIDALVVRWPNGAMQRFEKLAADAHYTIREREASPAMTFSPQADESAELAIFQPSQAIDVRHRERDFDDFAVQPLLRAWLAKVPVPRGGRVDVDVDPASFL